MRLSKSGLQMYLKCPYAYYLQYIEGHRAPPSDAMEMGVQFHELADNFFDKISLRELADQDSIFGIERYIRSFYPPGSLYDKYAHIQTVHYMSLNKKEEFIPIEREIKIEIDNAPDDILDVGIIDWIAREDGMTILGEYKSGKFRQGINQELMMYKGLVEYATDYKIDAVCAIYPQELYGTTLPSGVYFKKPSHEEYARKKVSYVKKMIRDKKFNEKKYSLCAWCGNADLCFENELVVE